MTDIRLIVFDLGRVLVRICENWRHAFEVAQIEVGSVEIDDARRAALRELVFANESGRMEKDEFCRRAGELFGVPPAHVAAMSDVYLLGIYPGAVELIDELHAGGYATACLSNTNANHWRLMSDPAAACCLPLERLQHRFGSHLIGARKPDDAIYAHVERMTGFSGPQIVFFDDMLENVEGAARRNWRAHHIDRERDEPVAQMREILKSYGFSGGR
jgi:HAD superfamily hydrolase (TIGR01509 family)